MKIDNKEEDRREEIKKLRTFGFRWCDVWNTFSQRYSRQITRCQN